MKYKIKKRNPKYWKKTTIQHVLNHFKNKNPNLSKEKIEITRVYKMSRTIIGKKFRAFYIVNVIIHPNKDIRKHLRFQATLPFRKRKWKFKLLGEYTESSAFASLKALARARTFIEKTAKSKVPRINLYPLSPENLTGDLNHN